MLDKQVEILLQIANTLTVEDLEALRTETHTRPDRRTTRPAETRSHAKDYAEATTQEACTDQANRDLVQEPEETRQAGTPSEAGASGVPRGEYERQRTRESKISTACIGRERERHEWWPVGTELVGTMGQETFTAMVVENQQVKSGRSLLITSGAASGKVCITPTRAAIEATEHYRQRHGLGRGGGVTNGWTFWQARA